MPDPVPVTLATLLDQLRLDRQAEARAVARTKATEATIRRALEAHGGSVEHDGAEWYVDDGRLYSEPVRPAARACDVLVGPDPEHKEL
jgi:uncharacterized phage protein gp47/JayE